MRSCGCPAEGADASAVWRGTSPTKPLGKISLLSSTALPRNSSVLGHWSRPNTLNSNKSPVAQSGTSAWKFQIGSPLLQATRVITLDRGFPGISQMQYGSKEPGLIPRWRPEALSICT